jgi:type II secretory pathway pseudopilin PulG
MSESAPVAQGARPSYTSPGFTVIELLIAVTLTIVLAGTAMLVFSKATDIFTKSDAIAGIHQHARVALEILERDVKGTLPILNAQGIGTGQYFKIVNGGEGAPPTGTAVGVYTDELWFKTTSAAYDSAVPAIKNYVDLVVYKMENGSLWKYVYDTSYLPKGIGVGSPVYADYATAGSLTGDPGDTTALSTANPNFASQETEMKQELCRRVVDFQIEYSVKASAPSVPYAFYTAGNLAVATPQGNHKGYQEHANTASMNVNLDGSPGNENYWYSADGSSASPPYRSVVINSTSQTTVLPQGPCRGPLPSQLRIFLTVQDGYDREERTFIRQIALPQ